MADTETLKPEKRFYVYAVCIGPRVAYIGKGTGRRAWTHLGKRGHNEVLNLKIIEARKLGVEPRVRVLKAGLTESEAYSLERRWIVRFHERLTNHTIGQRTWVQRFIETTKANLASLVSDETALAAGHYNGVSPEVRVAYLRKIRARFQNMIAAAEAGAFANAG